MAKKNLVLGPILVKFGLPKLFFKNLVPSVTRRHGQLSSCTIQEKNNDQILRDGQTDRQRDGQE